MSDELTKQAALLPEAVRQTLTRTPARLFTGRAGTGYLTATALQLRADHAAARDAVYDAIDLERDLGQDRVSRYGLFSVCSQAADRSEYLMRPDRGRRLSTSAETIIQRECPPGADLQIVLGDGLSASALAQHGGELLDLIWDLALARSWKLGKPFLVRNCRVGILNEVGRLLQPQVVVLLVGERPGLAQSASLSAYMAFQPQPHHTDAQRNLISNIHPHGVTIPVAAERLMNLATQLREQRCSGVMVKEAIANKYLT